MTDKIPDTDDQANEITSALLRHMKDTDHVAKPDVLLPYQHDFMKQGPKFIAKPRKWYFPNK